MSSWRAMFPVAAGLVGVMLSAGCAAGQHECQANTWSGSCELMQATLVRHLEVPVASVVYQATYRTLPDPQNPNAGAPGLNVQKEFIARDRLETALKTHIETHHTVPCYVTPPPAHACTPGTLNVEVPEFDALHAQVDEEEGPKGCAQIEARSSQDRLTKTSSGATSSINEFFEFPVGSADLTPEFGAVLDGVAQRLKGNSAIQCVGVVGAWTRGENMGLAFSRARTIREELLKRGVPPERMIALTVDPRPPSATAGAEPPSSDERRVNLKVLLEVPAP
ncbi:MAG TPA: hypothetical protein VFQ61_03760 [Polyangiaceae bacterium]|nr:hypothetical protein [Polyangiaceae bacterium]